MKVNGLTSIATARDAEMGIIILATDMFDITSVNHMTRVMNRKSNNATGSICSWASSSPSHCDRPLLLKPSANANPPPRSRTKTKTRIRMHQQYQIEQVTSSAGLPISHGIVFAVFQSSKVVISDLLEGSLSTIASLDRLHDLKQEV